MRWTTPISTRLIRNVPQEAIDRITERLAIKRAGTLEDVWNVVEFFLRRQNGFISGQVIYLAGMIVPNRLTWLDAVFQENSNCPFLHHSTAPLPTIGCGGGTGLSGAARSHGITAGRLSRSRATTRRMSSLS